MNLKNDPPQEMYTYRPSRNKIVLLLLIIVQLSVIVSYFLLFKPEVKNRLNKISFLPKMHTLEKPNKQTYHTLDHNVNLNRTTSRGFFLDFNSSMCFTEGTDIRTMIVIKGVNWKCNCLEGNFSFLAIILC